MKRHIPWRALRRPLTAVATGLLARGASAAAGTPAAASTAAPEAAVVDSGDGWTVTRAAGGYAVSLGLDTPLPVKDDIPQLLINGVDLGPATESADGRTLTVTTTDAHVATAESVTWRWSSGGNSTAVGAATLPSVNAQPKAQRDAKSDASGEASTTSAGPTTIGTGQYTIADYLFGAQSIALEDIGGIRGELEGRIYLPTGHGAHPLVIFLHGRHSSCYNTTTLKGTSGWPCPAGTAPILSYAG